MRMSTQEPGLISLMSKENELQEWIQDLCLSQVICGTQVLSKDPNFTILNTLQNASHNLESGFQLCRVPSEEKYHYMATAMAFSKLLSDLRVFNSITLTQLFGRNKHEIRYPCPSKLRRVESVLLSRQGPRDSLARFEISK